MHHELKILPCYFDAVKRGDKTFEIRDNSDRGFQKGDTITPREYDPSIAPVDSFRYTGMKVEAEITYVTGYARRMVTLFFPSRSSHALLPVQHR